MKPKRETPDEEIRRIKHWLVDQPITHLAVHYTADNRWRIEVGLDFVTTVDSRTFRSQLAAWRDIERQVQQAMEKGKAE